MSPYEPVVTGRSAVLVVNGRSRSGRGALDEAVEGLRARGVNVASAHLESDPGRIPAIVRGAVDDGIGLVVVGGGDGTVGSVAGLLAGRDVVLGVLPTGTANDFARTLQIPGDLEQACAIVAGGRVVDVDLGFLSGVAGRRAVVNVASVGLSVALTRSLTPGMKRRFGPLAYALAAVRAYRRHRPFGARLEFPAGDHEPVELDDLLQVAIANGRHYGGGSIVAPEAGIDDSLLDVYAIPRGTSRQRLVVARHFVSGRFVAADHVLHVRTTAVRLVTDPPLDVNADGELVDVTPVEVRVDPDALLVAVPVDSDAASLDRRPA